MTESELAGERIVAEDDCLGGGDLQICMHKGRIISMVGP